MSRLDLFAERLEHALSSVAQERLAEATALAAEMESADAELQRFTPLADAIHHLEIRPRLVALVSHFPNASVDHWLSTTGLDSHCAFARTERYPASVKLTLGIAHDSGRHRSTLQYKLEIIPLLIQLEQTDELEIDLSSPDMAEVVDWIERKLQSFLDTYMRIESDPNYQRENQQVDPVCGMHVQAGRVAHRAEYSRHIYYFCSQDCHEQFTASPESFPGLARILVPTQTAAAEMPSVST